jgi:pimeloyl-ACP methyl ester carboxylesterase
MVGTHVIADSSDAMHTFYVGDRAIRYRRTGSGTPVILTPGGRLGSSALASLARALEDHMQLIEWDRSNTGSSDLYLDAPPEQHRWADDAALLVEHLGLGSAIFIGGSAGARLAYLTAIRHPQVVSGLILWSVSGGGYSSQLLGYQYHTPYIEAAVRGGMAEVAETPHFSELIRANPAHTARLLAMDAGVFIAVMKSWNDVFYPMTAAPVIAATVSELRTVTAPTLVFNGNDDFHPAFAAQALHEAIPGSRLLPCAWTRDDWMLRYVGRIPESVVELYPRMSEAIIDYIREIEQP